MKTLIARLAIWAAPILAAGLSLPGCSLERSTYSPEYDAYKYQVSATVLSLSDGMRSVVYPGNLSPWGDPGVGHLVMFEVQADDAMTDAAARSYFKRELTVLLDPTDGHGAGPWCLLTAAVSSNHLLLRRWAVGTWAYAGRDELADCAPSTVLADLEVSRAEVPFDPVGVAFLSTVQGVTLTNRGGVPLDVAEPALDRTGQWLEFQVGRGTCGVVAPDEPLRLEPGVPCTFYVAFQPTAGGTRSADVRIASADRPDATVAVHLSGEGLPGVVAVDRNFCVPPDPADGCFRRDLQFLNLGPGRVTYESFAANGDWQLSNWRPHAPPIRYFDPSTPAAPMAVFVSVSSCVPDPAPTTLSMGLGGGEPPISVLVTPLTFPGRCTP